MQNINLRSMLNKTDQNTINMRSNDNETESQKQYIIKLTDFNLPEYQQVKLYRQKRDLLRCCSKP